jgi:hypothetical protein
MLGEGQGVIVACTLKKGDAMNSGFQAHVSEKAPKLNMIDSACTKLLYSSPREGNSWTCKEGMGGRHSFRGARENIRTRLLPTLPPVVAKRPWYGGGDKKPRKKDTFLKALHLSPHCLHALSMLLNVVMLCVHRLQHLYKEEYKAS